MWALLVFPILSIFLSIHLVLADAAFFYMEAEIDESSDQAPDQHYGIDHKCNQDGFGFSNPSVESRKKSFCSGFS